jgi:hypothetical protein
MNLNAYPYFPSVSQELLNKLFEHMKSDEVLQDVHFAFESTNGDYFPAILTWKGSKPLDPSANRRFEFLCEELGIHIGPKFTSS